MTGGEIIRRRFFFVALTPERKAAGSARKASTRPWLIGAARRRGQIKFHHAGARDFLHAADMRQIDCKRCAAPTWRFSSE